MTSQEYLKRLREQQALILEREAAGRERLERFVEQRAAVNRRKRNRRGFIGFSLAGFGVGVLLAPTVVYMTDEAVNILMARSRPSSPRDGALVASVPESSPSASPPAQPPMKPALSSASVPAVKAPSQSGPKPGAGAAPERRPDTMRRLPQRGSREQRQEARRPPQQDSPERPLEVTGPSPEQVSSAARPATATRALTVAPPEGPPAHTESPRVATAPPRIESEQATSGPAEQSSPPTPPPSIPSAAVTDPWEVGSPAKSSDPPPTASELVQPDASQPPSPEALPGPNLATVDEAMARPSRDDPAAATTEAPAPSVAASPRTEPTVVERAKKALSYLPQVRLAMMVARWVKSRKPAEPGSPAGP
jgi:hypothetical protein